MTCCRVSFFRGAPQLFTRPAKKELHESLQTIEQGNEYRVDYTATLRFKDGEAWDSTLYYRNPKYNGCIMVMSQAFGIPGEGQKITPNLDVSGYGVLVKSEKGWRLRGNLNYSFAQVAASQSKTSAVATPSTSAPTQTLADACVATKMTAWEKQHDNEVNQAGAAARAKGEEFQTSAGMEELERKEALDKTTAECR